MASQAEKQAYLEMMTRIYRAYGINSMDPVMFEDVETVQRDSVQLWVSQSSGNDAFEGTAGRPFKTINRALREVPIGMLALTTINVGRGTYREHLKLFNSFAMGGGLKIVGTDWDSLTLTSGPTSGTITTVTNRIVSVSGTPGWTIKEMEGSFLKITSGPLSGKYFPIYTNTTSTIEISALDTLSFSYSGLNGQTFSLVKPAAIVKKPVNDGNDTMVIASCYGGANYTLVTPADNGLIFQNLLFDGEGTSVRYFWISGNVQFINCTFPPVSPGSNTASVTGAAFASLTQGSSCSWVGCYARVPALVSTRGFFEHLSLDGCVFIATTGHLFDIFNSGNLTIRMEGVACLFESQALGGSGSAIWAVKGQFTGNVNIGITCGVTIKNCDHVMKSCAHGVRFNSLFAPMIVEKASYNGFWIFDDVIGASGHSTFWITNLTMSNILGVGPNPNIWGNGFGIQSPYVNVVLIDSTINNCPTSGIQMGGRVQIFGRDAGSFGNVYLNNCTMSGNGSGGGKDFTLDGGVTYLTLADAQNAANTGTTTNTVLFNRLRANPVGV